MHAEPNYRQHRGILPISPAVEVVVDTAVLADLPRYLVNCAGWLTVRVFVRIASAGGNATGDFTPLELVKYVDVDGVDQEEYTIIGSATGALADGESAAVAVNGGMLFLRLSGVANTPTAVDVYVAGETRMDHEPGQGRV